MIFTNSNNSFDYNGVEELNKTVLQEMYNSQTDIRGELFLLEEAILGKKISKEDIERILKFYCETPITTQEEDSNYPNLKKRLWKVYKDSGKNSNEYKNLKKEFDILDSKLTPYGRDYAIESIINNEEVTHFETLFKNVSKYQKVDSVLEDIKTEKYSNLIDKIRTATSDEEKAKLKKKLPVILWNGLFYERNKYGIFKFNDYMCLDFDDFASHKDVNDAKDKLKNDPYVYAFFVSPKGLGLKVILRVNRKDKWEHLALFEGAKQHFSHIDGFDDACKDLARACYLSSDSDLYINKNSSYFTKKGEINYGHENLSVTKKKNSKQNIKILQAEAEKMNSIFNETEIAKIKKLVIDYWESKNEIVEGNRNNNLYKLAIKLYSAGVPKPDVIELFYEKYKGIFENDDELDTIVTSACKEETNFASQPWQNYELKRKVISLLDKENELNELLIENNIDYKDSLVQLELKELKIKNYKFWETITNKEGSVTSYRVNEFRVIEFLKSANIFCLNEGGSFRYHQIKDNLIYDRTLYDIRNLIINYIEETQGDNEMLISVFLKQKSIYTDLFLSGLKKDSFKSHRDSSDTVYKYFSNGVLIISKQNKNQIVSYLDLDYPVHFNQVIKHNYNGSCNEKSDFETFVEDISGDNIDSFRSAIGYLSSNYKSQANAKAVILNDPSASFQSANGGKGKGVLGKALAHMNQLTRVDGKQYKADDNFALAAVKEGTGIAFIDDVKQNFHLTDIYNLITDSFEITAKYKDKKSIPFELAPKILLSSNYPIKGSDESSKRRRFDLVFSDYYSTKKTPIMKFKKDFFTSWNEKEWNAFFKYMTLCVKFYLEKGLIPMSTDSMKMKELIGDTSEDFISFMEDNKESMETDYFKLEDIKQEYYRQSNQNVSVRKLKSWIIKWGEFNSYTLKDTRENNKRLYKLKSSTYFMEIFNPKAA